MAAVVCFALGMGTKEVMATAPLVALLYDRTFLAGSFGGALRRRWGLYLALALIWGAVVPWQLFTEDPTIGFNVPTMTPLEYLTTQAGVLLHYVRLAFWPYPQSLDYQGWPVAHTLADCLLPGSVVVAAMLGTLWALWRRPWLGFLGACFFLILAPTSSIIPIVDVAFEHRMYLPLAPLVVLAVLGGWEGLLWLARRFDWSEAARRGLGAGLVCLLVGTLTALTFLRNEDYRSGRTIWAAVLRQWPHAPRAHINLAISYVDRRQDFDRGQAQQHLEEALKWAPGDPIARHNLGVVLWWAGEEDRALRELARVASTFPSYGRVRANLGKVLFLRGRAAEAAAQFQAAVELEPRRAEYRFALALARQELGKDQEAQEAIQAGLRLKGDWPQEARRTAWALLQEDPAKRGRVAKDALFLARQARLATGDADPEALDVLAAAYAANGQFDRAVATATSAARRADALAQHELAASIRAKLAGYQRGAARGRPPTRQ